MNSISEMPRICSIKKGRKHTFQEFMVKREEFSAWNWMLIARYEKVLKIYCRGKLVWKVSPISSTKEFSCHKLFETRWDISFARRNSQGTVDTILLIAIFSFKSFLISRWCSSELNERKCVFILKKFWFKQRFVQTHRILVNLEIKVF